MRQRRKRAPHGSRPGNDDIVMARGSVQRHNPRDGRAQAPTRPVTLNRAADPPAGRQSDAQRARSRRTPAGLQNQAGRRNFAPARSDPQIIRPAFDRADSPSHDVRQRAGCGPFFGGGPIRGVLLSLPFGSGTRGDACARGGLADRCVSRQVSCAPVFRARCIEAHLIQVN